ncbi:MAG: response regulator [SAR324 cluster bacterium]|nr:response regulator [SAR324 cluster bacterium]
MKILVVDDESSLLSLLERGLLGQGHTVETAENGQEGWEKFIDASDPFDFIIADIRMPVMSGLELLKKIRIENVEVPVVIMTGHGDLNNAIEALRLGTFDFLLKPFKFEQITSILRKFSGIQSPAQEFKNILPFYDEKIQISIPSQTKFIPKVVYRLNDIIAPIFHLYRISSTHLAMCLGEAINNAVIHGNLEIPSSLKEESWDSFQEMTEQREVQPEYGEKIVTISCILSHQRLEIIIEDQGKGFNYKSLSEPTDLNNLLSTSGRGLFLIRMAMDEVSWNERGNKIHIVKFLQSSLED